MLLDQLITVIFLLFTFFLLLFVFLKVNLSKPRKKEKDSSIPNEVYKITIENTQYNVYEHELFGDKNNNFITKSEMQKQKIIEWMIYDYEEYY